MADPTNKERLASIETSIKHIDGNIEKIATNNVSQWKTINQNSKDIAKMKGIGAVVALVFTAVCGYLGIKQ